MTCIVGLEHDGVVYIGGDSAGIAGNKLDIRRNPKVFRLFDRKDAIIGYTTSFRMGQLLMYERKLLPRFFSHRNTHQVLVTKFIPRIRKVFSEGGFTYNDSGKEYGGIFLLGLRDKLWIIESDFQVGRSDHGYAAIGCGTDYALGSLVTTQGIIEDPVKRVQLALEAAAKHSTGVEAPFIILNTEDNKVFTVKKESKTITNMWEMTI